jgi:hypothetical protein
MIRERAGKMKWGASSVMSTAVSELKVNQRLLRGVSITELLNGTR